MLYSSEEVSVAFARVPMVVTGSVACLARYFIHVCLLASLLHDTSYYSVTTSAAGQLKLVASVRAMIVSNTKANPRKGKGKSKDKGKDENKSDWDPYSDT